MKFSMIIGTLNREKAIKYCLKSLLEQNYENYEIIIIDQSDNDKTEKYVKNLSEKRIKYMHVDYKGLSRARNDALKLASGDYFCLIDDDAYYDSDYLLNASKLVKDRKTIVSGYIYDTISERAFVKYNKKKENRQLSIRDITRICPSAGLVIPLNVIEDVGFFDEKFGVGARYGAGEETDLLLRSIKRGYKVIYSSKLYLKHPVPKINNIANEDLNIKKRISYYNGCGALYGKHLKSDFNLSLEICFWEIKFKFLIKRVCFFKYRKKDILYMLRGFEAGYKEYGA